MPLRSCLLGLTLAMLPLPAVARDVVGSAEVTFRWASAGGPVAGYAVYVSRDGAGFPSVPEVVTDADVPEATVEGDFGERVAIRVAAFDAQARMGPFSPASETVRFVRSPGGATPPGEADSVGVFDPGPGAWFRRGTDGSSPGVVFGFAGTHPVVGDWTGQGRDELAVYDPRDGSWYLRGQGTRGAPSFRFGFAGTLPVAGDWDGDGRDEVGLHIPSAGFWLLRHGEGEVELVSYGIPDTLPVVGDWNGDGIDDVGLYAPASGAWFRRGVDGSRPGLHFGFAGTLPAVGDWDGDGHDELAIYHPASGNWYLRGRTPGGRPTFRYGSPGTLPIVGRW